MATAMIAGPFLPPSSLFLPFHSRPSYLPSSVAELWSLIFSLRFFFIRPTTEQDKHSFSLILCFFFPTRPSYVSLP